MLNEENSEQSSDDAELRSFMNQLEREKQRDKKRPMIEHLDDAISIVDGKITFKLKVSDSLVIERYTNFNGVSRWFDTRTYEIKAINADTGAVRLYDLENKQFASTNFITGFSNKLYKFKIPTKAKIKSRVKWDKQVEKAEAKNTQSSGPQKDGLRVVYAKKNVIHTRISNVPYGPTGDTQAVPGMRLKMTLNNSKLIVEHPENKWTETWVKIDLK